MPDTDVERVQAPVRRPAPFASLLIQWVIRPGYSRHRSRSTVGKIYDCLSLFSREFGKPLIKYAKKIVARFLLFSCWLHSTGTCIIGVFLVSFDLTPSVIGSCGVRMTENWA